LIPSFASFLENKPLYYDKIDTRRIIEAYEVLKAHIRCVRAVHIVGTNGKGSTGRALAHLAFKSGLRVGHFSSPHILHFNERIWIDGVCVDEASLEIAHQRLYTILGKERSEALSYFEYTTLLAFILFEECDLVVLEAGLGGRDDATNVYPKALSLITPIGLEHQAFLGDDIGSIARVKIESINKKVIVAPQPHKEVLAVAKAIAKEKGTQIEFLEIAALPYLEAIAKIAEQKAWSDFLITNICVALKALEALELTYDIKDLKSLELFGRLYPLQKNILLDVGHNLLAAQVIEKALAKETVLIYNSLDDKDYEQILKTLQPKIKKVLIIPIQTKRALDITLLQKALEKLGIEYEMFDIEKLKEDEHYLVFGSFYVVEAFLKTSHIETIC
jgi:dihydrofolate synthase / folylpolyglutamate synthase